MNFKIIFGYDAEDYLGIDETELEKAYYCFLEKKDSIFSGGAVRGSNIMAIQPDYHAAMGWNRGHKLGGDDYAELKVKGIERKHSLYLSETKSHVQSLIQSGQTHLIGKSGPAALPTKQ